MFMVFFGVLAIFELIRKVWQLPSQIALDSSTTTSFLVPHLLSRVTERQPYVV